MSTHPVDALVEGINPDELDTASVQAARDLCDEEVEVSDTSPWIICPDCSGEGKHSRHLGSFTSEDIERDWDPDDWEDYLQGGYDRQCDVCRGSGKVRLKAWANLKERRAEFASENHHEFHPGYGRYGY